MAGFSVKRVAAVVAALALVAVAGAFTDGRDASSSGEVHLAMISPLTGPLANVGNDNRAGVNAALALVNKKGGIKGKKVVVDVFDDGSNPAQAVVFAQQAINDSKYLGIIGSGFSSASLAAEPLAVQAHIPYVSMAGSAAQVEPPRPYVYMVTATSRLFAYSMAKFLRAKGLTKVALIADNGGYGREGVANVKELAGKYGLNVVSTSIFPLSTTSFTAELTKIKSSDAQALWIYNATTAAVAITKEAQQLQLPQKIVLTGGNASHTYLDAACPASNGAYITSYQAPVAKYLPKSNRSRPLALQVDALLNNNSSTFAYDGFVSIFMYKAAMERGGFTREGINNAIENKLKGFVGPGGRYFYGPLNHFGLGLKDMVISQIKDCAMFPISGTPLKAKKKK